MLRKLIRKFNRWRYPATMEYTTISAKTFDALLESLNILSDPETISALTEGEDAVAADRVVDL